MITFGNNKENNDLATDLNGIIIYFDDLDALINNINESLRLFYGEHFLDTTLGIPYFINILGDNINLDIAGSIITSEILKHDMITNITNIDFILDPTQRLFTYTCLLQTIYGDTDYNFSST